MVSALCALLFSATIAFLVWIPRHYAHVWAPAYPIGMRFKGYGVVYVSRAVAVLFYASFWGAVALVVALVAMVWHYVSTGRAVPVPRKTPSTEITELHLNDHE